MPPTITTGGRNQRRPRVGRRATTAVVRRPPADPVPGRRSPAAPSRTVIGMSWAAIRALARRHPRLADTALGIVVVAVPGAVRLAWIHPPSGALGTVDIVAVATALVLMAGRRVWPMPFLL